MRILIVSNSAKRKLKAFIKKHPEHRVKLEQIITNLLKNLLQKKIKVHRLSGKLKFLYAASITYEYRLIYFFDDQHVYLINIGSHDEVY